MVTNRIQPFLLCLVLIDSKPTCAQNTATIGKLEEQDNSVSEGVLRRIYRKSLRSVTKPSTHMRYHVRHHVRHV